MVRIEPAYHAFPPAGDLARLGKWPLDPGRSRRAGRRGAQGVLRGRRGLEPRVLAPGALRLRDHRPANGL